MSVAADEMINHMRSALTDNSPLPSLSANLPLRLRLKAKEIIQEETPLGERFMRIANTALVLNLIGTTIDTMPQTDRHVAPDILLEVNEFLTGTIFILEYLIRFFAADSCRTFAVRRSIDAICLFPTLGRIWIRADQGD